MDGVTHDIASLDGGKDEGAIPNIVGTDIGQDLWVGAMGARATELVDEPPSQAVDDIGQLGVVDGDDARPRHPLGIGGLGRLNSQSVDNVWQQGILPLRNLLVLGRHGVHGDAWYDYVCCEA